MPGRPTYFKVFILTWISKSPYHPFKKQRELEESRIKQRSVTHSLCLLFTGSVLGAGTRWIRQAWFLDWVSSTSNLISSFLHVSLCQATSVDIPDPDCSEDLEGKGEWSREYLRPWLPLGGVSLGWLSPSIKGHHSTPGVCPQLSPPPAPAFSPSSSSGCSLLSYPSRLRMSTTLPLALGYWAIPCGFSTSCPD